MAVPNQNVYLEGVFSAETPDTSGEVLSVRGADISSLNNSGYLNTEHIAPEDGDKSESDGAKGFETVVGRVVKAKKIFSAKDCETRSELRAWNKFLVPLIYGTIEIWDGPDAHPNARAAASIAKMLSRNPDGPKLGLSVEGATLQRKGKSLAATVIRGMALTLKPCLRTATVDLVQPTEQDLQLHKKEYVGSFKGNGEPLFRSTVSDVVIAGNQEPSQRLLGALETLKKTLTAGSGNAAPGALTQGSALQAPPSMHKLANFFGKKKPKKDEILKAIPGLDEYKAEAIAKAMEDYELEKSLRMTNAIYNTLKTGK